MKLVINYDFFNAIKDVNEGFTPMKIVRNNKKVLVTYSFPIWFILDYSVFRNLSTTLKVVLLQFIAFYMGGEYIIKLLLGKDIYEEKSRERLKILVSKLKDLNVDTDYKLLIESELQEKKYKIHLNESKIPEIIENKYILVPTYNFNGNIKHTSINQEHIVGTNEYILSIGTPKKELKLVYSNI